MPDFVPYSSEHLSSLTDIFRSNMPTYFLEHELAQFIRFLDDPGNYYTVKENGEVKGCGGYYLNKDDTVSLCWGMVHRDHHKTGIGRALLEFRLKKIKEFHPGKKITQVTSQHTTAFFEKFGFKLITVKKDGFGPGLDECRMDLIS